ncbi:thioredoxin fold domain-containing protein [Desulfosarcina sp. OttesenSCG-928-A07]|nr:thioredoxin fold domain-containing protein [Desulfosarcina sp. OttesenSCG-928-G17]MDL2328864.1 thioredoxin fold domain-containing protein [Desulfosarcina sp. OttesenSCG-928-A07]
MQTNLIYKAMAAFWVILLFLPSIALSATALEWVSYETGLKLGKEKGKKLLVVFFTDQCTYCYKMGNETFRDPAVMDYVKKNFIPVSVDADQRQDVVKRFGVRGYPTTCFTESSGKEIAGLPGFFGPQDMLWILRYVSSDSYQSMSLKAFIQKDGD